MTNPANHRGGASRRSFMSTVGVAAPFPTVVPPRALGRGGAAAPSERIGLGVIGYGPRCTYDLGPMLARKRAIAASPDDVVLLDRDGDIAEAPIANAFAVVAGTLWTPPLGRVLPGITRDSVLALARDEGIPVREERLPLDVFTSADEAFLTSTSLPIAPIGWVNGRPLREASGPVTTRIVERIAAAQRGADPSRDAWLTYVR